MMQQVKDIDWDDLEIAIPAFLTIVLMPFTYSITVGIGAGFVSYVLIKVVRGKARAIHPLMWVVAGAVRRLLRDHPDQGARSASADVAGDRRPPVCRVAPHQGRRGIPCAGSRVAGVDAGLPEIVSTGNELC